MSPRNFDETADEISQLSSHDDIADAAEVLYNKVEIDLFETLKLKKKNIVFSICVVAVIDFLTFLYIQQAWPIDKGDDVWQVMKGNNE